MVREFLFVVSFVNLLMDYPLVGTIVHIAAVMAIRDALLQLILVGKRELGIWKIVLCTARHIEGSSIRQ
jgi:hypothetical protein